MQQKNELTYLFGAGASCKSMPLVNSFCDRYEVYIKFLERMNAHPHFIMENQGFNREIRSHASFYTYFKKLYHQKNREPAIRKDKYFIYLYFLFEHLCDVKYINDVSTGFELKCRKECACDPRYDALIAGLLKPYPQKIEFYCNINFLSWNYDLQLLWSLYRFLGQDVSFRAFLDENRKEQNIFEFGRQLKVIHLGGLMDPLEYIDNLNGTPVERLSEIFHELVENYNNEPYVQEHISGLNFSWENGTDENPIPHFIQKASEAVCRSHSIIITGYSFPLYNRFFDLSIFDEQRLNHKSIYITDPNAGDYKKVLHKDFRIADMEDRNAYVMNPAAPIIYTNCVTENFFVPPQIF